MFNTVTEKIRQGCSTARAPGGNFSVSFATDGRGQTMDRSLVEVMKEASTSIVGASNVLVLKRKTWAEDFSAYSAIIPGAMVLLGSRSPGAPRSAHTDTFDIDDSNLHLGAAILAKAAMMASKRFSSQQR
jgi:Metal-dependent amidase/aminoacylase/carboxypeptidase